MASHQVEVEATTQQTQTHTPPEKKITLKSRDGSLFEIEKAVAMELRTVKNYLDVDGDLNEDDNIIVPLPNVASAQLTQVIVYCKNYVGIRNKNSTSASTSNNNPEEGDNAFNKGFVKDLSNDMLKDLLLAAHYLEVDRLINFMEVTIADRIKNKSVEFVRRFFNIANDFSVEEEEEIRQQNSWAFEGVDED